MRDKGKLVRAAVIRLEGLGQRRVALLAVRLVGFAQELAPVQVLNSKVPKPSNRAALIWCLSSLCELDHRLTSVPAQRRSRHNVELFSIV